MNCKMRIMVRYDMGDTLLFIVQRISKRPCACCRTSIIILHALKHGRSHLKTP